MIKSIYNFVPYTIKCVLASVYGFYLDNIRYDSNLIKRVEKYIERESWQKSQLIDWQEEELQRTLFYAKKYVPHYREYWKTKNESPTQLKNWPITTKKQIIQNPNSFIDERYSEFNLYHDHTSGTTGTPIDIFLDYDSVKEQYALFGARVKLKYNINFNDRWAIIGAQRVTKAENKNPPYWVYNFSSKQLYFSSLHIADWSSIDYYEALVKYQPKYMIGYTNSIYELANFMLSRNLKFRMKAIITNAEPLYDYQMRKINKAFKCPVVETYGQAELVCFANKFPDGQMYESPEMGFSEIVDINNQSERDFGKLISTGFLNKAMPLIRYDTDDLIFFQKEKNIKNNISLPLFRRLIGRSDDILVTEDGRKVVQIDGIFSSDLKILNAQIVQKNITDFIIKVVPDEGWSDNSIETLKSKFLERIFNANVRIEICEEIEKTWAGKFQVIKSDLKYKR